MLVKSRIIRKSVYILVFLALSCGSAPIQQKPTGVLEKEEIIPLIVDLQILESHFQRQFARIDLYRDALDSSSVSIFENHEISKETFESSIDYYSSTPDSLYSIYEAALDSIKFRLDRVNSEPVTTP